MLGSGGSNRIRTALAQVLSKLIDTGARLDDAIEAPRLHVDAGDPVAVDFEDLMGEGPHAALKAAFPQANAWPERSMFFGGVHAVRRDGGGSLDAAGDPRRAGVAIKT
jgi:gamma-glutamyltranspeptidase/glutathione hydrolase